MSNFSKEDIVLNYLKIRFGEPNFIDFKIEGENVNQYIRDTNYLFITSNIDKIYSQMNNEDILRAKGKICSDLVKKSDQVKARKYSEMIYRELGE